MTVASRTPLAPPSPEAAPAILTLESSAAGERDLGPLAARYPGRPFRRDDLANLLLPGALAVLAPLAYGWWRGSYAYARFGLVAADRWSRPWYLLAAFALGVFLFLVLYRLRLLRRFVAVHQNGIRFRMGTIRVRQLLWNEISGITMDVTQERLFGLTVRTIQRAVLLPNLGKPVRLDSSVQDLDELLSRIKAGLYPRLLRSLRDSYQAGQWLYFGPVAVQQQGLRFGHSASGRLQQPIPWAQVSRVSVQSGRLVVEFNGLASRRFPISQIPNLELLLQMMQQGANL